ncbi:hypothetical protein ETB97_008476 [Aspergillus alliaceus]|uniref:Uncharacterized protein n=1 Tax=Petromyces alliaceus TaxID=209559 RepID=A0A8H5ZS03_PETAA|nr:hypothetical protein ETB97_008476 [Aspergillus burnettii]
MQPGLPQGKENQFRCEDALKLKNVVTQFHELPYRTRAMENAHNQVLLTEATAYIRGTVLNHLIKSEATNIKDLAFDLLLQSEDAAEKPLKIYRNCMAP